MLKNIIINIPEPCSQSWEQMTPVGKGKHCNSCKQTVYDFTQMSNAEILNFISTHGQVCGHYYKNQLGQLLQPEKKRKYIFTNFWSWLLSSMLISGSAASQNIKKVSQEQVTPAQIQPVTIAGEILDLNTHEAIENATIFIQNKGASRADSSGKFILKNIFPSDSLQISRIGYETLILQANANTETIYLKKKGFTLQPVTVYPDINKVRVMGTGSFCTIDTWYNRILRVFNDSIPFNNLKIYPNPVKKGESIKVELNISRENVFLVQVIDANGRILWMQPVNASKSQTFTIPINPNWQSGVYWVYLSGKNSKTYQTKIMIL